MSSSSASAHPQEKTAKLIFYKITSADIDEKVVDFFARNYK